MATLRRDQAQAIGDLREAARNKRVVYSAPTGAGKGMIISDIVSRARDRHKRVLITVPALSLVDQTVMALGAYGIEQIGVIQARHPLTDWAKPVQVCSVQTLDKRWKDGVMPEADIVLVDEVHRMFDLFANWMPDPKWIDVPFIGFSATPWSKGLGVLYKDMVSGPTMKQLIADKVLVPFRTFAPDMPDLSGVRILGGEFIQADLDEVMRPKKLVANIVETWREKASNRPTVAFCCSRAHAKQVMEEFTAVGVGAAYLDCDSAVSERNDVRRRMLAGEVQVVCNVDVVGIGVDWPEVSCIIYARPTRSDIRYVQNIGRGLRAAPGKEDLLILDHSTTTLRLGFVDEIYLYHPALDDMRPNPKAEKGVLLPKECPNCHLLKAPRLAVCPHCGHTVEAHADPVRCERGSLREIGADEDIERWREQLPDKAHCFGQLWWYAHQKGYKPGWAARKVLEIFGSYPRAREPLEEYITSPVPELVNYLWVSKEKWLQDMKSERAKQRRQERAAMTKREQQIIDDVRDQYQPSDMSESDWDDYRG